jgi:hypothetical protein
MASLHLAIDIEPKDPRQSECRADMKTGAGFCQIVDRAWHFLSRRSELDDSAFMGGIARVFSAVKHRQQ